MTKKVWISGEWSKEKRLHLRLTIWTCIYLSLVLAGKSATVGAATALQVDRVNNAVQGGEVSDDAALASSSERTSNAIAEADEAGFESLKKSEKPLSKPYPYAKLQEPGSKKLDNRIQPSKRSDKESASPAVVDFNGTIFLSVSGPAESTESADSTDLEKPTTPMSTPLGETSTASTTASQDLQEDTTVYQDDADVDTSSTPFDATITEAETSLISSPSTTVESEIASSEADTTDGETTFETMHSSTATSTVKTTESTVNKEPTTSEATTVNKESTASEATTVNKESTASETTTVNKETTAGETTTVIPQDSSIPISTVTEEEETLATTSSTTAMIPVSSETTEILSTAAKSVGTTPTSTTVSNVTMKTTAETITPEIFTTEPTTTMLPTMATTTTTAPYTLVPLLTPTTSQTETALTSIESETATTAAATNLITLLTTASTTPATTMATSPLIITTSPRPTTPMSSGTDLTTGTSQEDNAPITTNAPPSTVSNEDATIFIRIVLEGGWEDICSKLPDLQQSLAELLNNNVDKKVSPSQIVFHQTQCSDRTSISRSLLSEIPLTSVLLYVVDEKGRFDEYLTKILPTLYQKTPIDFSLTIHSFVLLQESDPGNAIAVVIVSCVAFICLILLAGLLIIMRKRQGRFNYGERCRPVSLDAYSLDSVSAYNSVRRSKNALRSSKRSYGNPTFEDSSAIPSHPLNFAGITTFCNDVNAVNDEFASIPQVSSKIDELPAGVDMKNRYANVIPLPETRVPLQMLNNDPTTEYINASYVRGPKNASKYYIACQAPTEQTVSDFWRMIWEQQCKVIIMLTDLVENGVEKCCEYIPPLEVSDCHRLYGDFQVTLKKREAKEKYAISTLHLKNLESNTFREVSHIWYLWPANGVPTDGAALIAVLLEARALQRGAAGPIVVHCSPGTGRTGTLIALDLGIRQYEITRTVDVPRVVYTIRRDRAGAVQTREQYIFIYKALNLYASKLAGGAIEASY